MTVKLRPYRHGDGWEVDIRIKLDSGRKYRERRKSPVASKSGSRAWGEARERHLLEYGPDPHRVRPALHPDRTHIMVPLRRDARVDERHEQIGEVRRELNVHHA